MVNWRRGKVAYAALGLSLATGLFAVSQALLADGRLVTPLLAALADVLRIGVWLSFLTVVFRAMYQDATQSRLVMASHAIWLLLLLELLYPPAERWLASVTAGLLAVPTLNLLASFAIILLIEQLYRNTRHAQKKSVRYLGLGLGIPAAFDLCLAAHTVLFGENSALLVVPRGFVYALGAPLLAVALQRNDRWDVGVFVSRQIVFYTTSVMGIGVYLLAMAIVGFSIQSLDWQWGPVLQSGFFIAAITLFLWILFSDQVRASLKVWIHKHFYENRYDYREEWLRLTQTLSRSGEEQLFGERCVNALAQVVGADAGALWTLTQDGQAYAREYAWNAVLRADELPLEHPLTEFVDEQRWVLDLREAKRKPDRYERIESVLTDLPFADGALLVPLQYEERLLGIVELHQGATGRELNYEDHDLLKTAGQQIASFLAQRNTASLLAQSRQFEAFNKFTAFVMHDLNNLIAQQGLMLQNAKKYKSNPEFVDDAFKTIANSVQRMEGLLKQLRERSDTGVQKRIAVAPLVDAALTRAQERLPAPQIGAIDADAFVRADPDRLEAVIGHMIRNAQEATADTGTVTVSTRVDVAADRVVITISDTGTGMSSAFIRDQLFHPFISTKGSKGMGIGVYQTREYLRLLGGDMQVDSVQGQGTTIDLLIPAAPQDA